MVRSHLIFSVMKLTLHGSKYLHLIGLISEPLFESQFNYSGNVCYSAFISFSYTMYVRMCIFTWIRPFLQSLFRFCSLLLKCLIYSHIVAFIWWEALHLLVNFMYYMFNLHIFVLVEFYVLHAKFAHFCAGWMLISPKCYCELLPLAKE